jgi:hypothetical protein
LDIVLDISGLTDDLLSMITPFTDGILAKPTLRLWTPEGSEVAFVRQVAPTLVDMTAASTDAGPGTRDYPLGIWGVESHEFHIAVSLPTRRAAVDVIGTRAGIVCWNTAGQEETVAQATISPRWGPPHGDADEVGR